MSTLIDTSSIDENSKQARLVGHHRVQSSSSFASSSNGANGEDHIFRAVNGLTDLELRQRCRLHWVSSVGSKSQAIQRIRTKLAM